jgi:hypothetical protein
VKITYGFCCFGASKVKEILRFLLFSGFKSKGQRKVLFAVLGPENNKNLRISFTFEAPKQQKPYVIFTFEAGEHNKP